MSDMQFSEAFIAVMELAESRGVSKINQLDGCWSYQIDDQWWIAVNGHTVAVESPVSPLSGLTATVEPFSVFVEFCGWPAGFLDPFGGIIAAGAAANEDTFIAAVKAATVAPPSAEMARAGAPGLWDGEGTS